MTLDGIERTPLADFYPAEPIEVTASLTNESLPLPLEAASNLGVVATALRLSERQISRLRASGLVVQKASGSEDVAFAYQELTSKNVPCFITSDTLLHLYHVQFDELLKSVEERVFVPDLRQMSAALQAVSALQYAAFNGELKEAARRNVAFFSVAARLLDPGAAVPDYVLGEIQAEISLIGAHSGYCPSPIFHYWEDYSQYVPRGHYTRSENLKRFFKSMMWFGRIGFLLKGCDRACPYCDCFISEAEARVQTFQAALITVALDRSVAEGRPVGAIWDRIYAVTSYFVGLADDLTPYEYLDAIRGAFGCTFELGDLADPERLHDLKTRLALLPSPQIYGGTGACQLVPPLTPDQLDECLDRSKGLRFMGQRFVPDSYMMQNLVSPRVGPRVGAGVAFTQCRTPGGEMRCFPRGLDVMALLGSREAMRILRTDGDASYQGYDAAFDELASHFSALTHLQWNQNLYWSWLYSLKTILAEPGSGHPAFMSTPAWKRKQLNAALASWAQLRHDTILYAKQSTTPGTTVSVPPPPRPDAGYVEPVPETYHHLQALTLMTRLGLGSLGVLQTAEVNRLVALEGILQRLKTISLAELEAQPVSDADYEFIKEFGLHLQAVLAGVSTGAGQPMLVADVHTDGNTMQVLEEGVGYFDLIVVAYRGQGDRLLVGAGPVFSYYEFKWPMSDRLTDEAWKCMLEFGEEPDQPSWIRSLSTEGLDDPAPFDADGDADVDRDDLAVLVSCFTGPHRGPAVPGCSSCDRDRDGDVDQSDFGHFQRCFSGRDVAANPQCASAAGG